MPTSAPSLRPPKPPRRQLLASAATWALGPLLGAASTLGGCGGSAVADAPTPSPPDPRDTAPNRSITLQIHNHLEETPLAFGMAASHQGSLPQAQPTVLPPGTDSAIVASNHSGDCTGSFRWAGGNAWFDVHYTHPYGPGDTTVQVSMAEGLACGANALRFPGHHSLARLNLYRGVRNAAGALVVPLSLPNAPAANNAQDFVNSLFAPGVRDAGILRQAQASSDPGTGIVAPADFTGGQMAGFVALWRQYWLGDTPEAHAMPASDARLLGVLRTYVDQAASNGPLSLWVPQLQSEPGSTPAAYGLTGYRAFALQDASRQWVAQAVHTLLTLLAAGAHIVVIGALQDLPSGVTVEAFDHFLSRSQLPLRYDIGSSHYANVLNTTGHYYLDIADDFAPEDCGLLLALLSGRTVNSATAGSGAYNSFLQLEGWQAGLVHNTRHQADYRTHQDTLWNLSTFGACPYSEKRGTTVFLAPSGWTPQVYQTTAMMPYVGAYALSPTQPQPWLDRRLVHIPPGAPALPSRFIV